MINPQSLMGQAFQKSPQLLPQKRQGVRGAIRPQEYIDLTRHSSVSEGGMYSHSGSVRHRSKYLPGGNTVYNVYDSGSRSLDGRGFYSGQFPVTEDYQVDTTTGDTTVRLAGWEIKDGRIMGRVAGPDGQVGTDYIYEGKCTTECGTGTQFRVTSGVYVTNPVMP